MDESVHFIDFRSKRSLLSCFPRSVVLTGLVASLVLLSCGTSSAVKTAGYNPEQPLYPTAGDDPFFFKKVQDDEVFRVLVSKDNYQVRQVSAKKLIRRPLDPDQDKVVLEGFYDFHERYNFTDQVLTATLSVRLNPHSGKIQNLEFVPTENPQSWQVGRLMQHDLKRYKFRFPTGQVQMPTFRIRYMFRITRDPNLTEEEARRKAVEFISSERR